MKKSGWRKTMPTPGILKLWQLIIMSKFVFTGVKNVIWPPKFMCVFWGQSKGISALLHCYHVRHMLFNISLESLESRLSEALRM